MSILSHITHQYLTSAYACALAAFAEDTATVYDLIRIDREQLRLETYGGSGLNVSSLSLPEALVCIKSHVNFVLKKRITHSHATISSAINLLP